MLSCTSRVVKLWSPVSSVVLKARGRGRGWFWGSSFTVQFRQVVHLSLSAHNLKVGGGRQPCRHFPRGRANYKYPNPQRACAGGLGYLSCVCVCVCLFPLTSLVSTLKMRSVEVCRVYRRLFLLFNLWIFDKSFRSGVMA